MDEIVAEMDSIMTRLMRSTMDHAYEKVQLKVSPIECLIETSKFYELAIILINGGLELFKEEPDDRIPETSRKKMFTGLTELRDLLRERLNHTKCLITEKDKVLIERLENEYRLRQALESKDRELVSLRSKLQFERSKSEKIQEFLLSQLQTNIDKGKEKDFIELKNLVDKEVLSMKQRFEEEGMNFTSTTRKPSPNLAGFEPQLKEKVEVSLKTIMSVGDLLRPHKRSQILMINQMTTDIDLLKGTLDLAFGQMHNVTIRPLEKQWRWLIEKETILITINGFIQDLKSSIEFPTCSEVIDEMVELRDELQTVLNIRNEAEERKSRRASALRSGIDSKDNVARNFNGLDHIRRANSEPLMGHNNVEDLEAEYQSCNEIGKKVCGVIVRLDMFINHKNKPEEGIGVNVVRKYPDFKNQKQNTVDDIANKDVIITRLMEERHESSLQTMAMEENYVLLVNNCYNEFWAYDIETNVREDVFAYVLREVAKDWRAYDENERLKMQLTNEIYKLVFVETINDIQIKLGFEFQEIQNEISECRIKNTVKEDLYAVFTHETIEKFKSENEGFKTIKSSLTEDIYIVFFQELVEDLNIERYLHELQISFVHDVYRLVIDGLKESQVFMSKNTDLSHQTLITKINLLLELSEKIKGELMTKRSSFEDQTTFSLVNDKLERAARMFSASQEQLRELDYSLATKPDLHLTEDVIYIFLTDFQENVNKKLHTNFARLERISQQVDTLSGLAASVKKDELVYKKAFAKRCENLVLAETEVDLLGDQVEALQDLLQKIYFVLAQNTSVLPHDFEVMDILNLIKKEFCC